jgi:AraC-like DNA-binding protein
VSATGPTAPAARARAAKVEFSTKQFAERERLSAWREIFGRTVCQLDIEPLAPAAFSSKATAYQLPGLGVLFAASGAMEMHHTRELIADDDLSIMAAPTCRYVASQLGRTVELEAGSGVLMTNAEAGSMRLAAASDFVTFRVPRSTMVQRVPDLEAAVARCIAADNVALRLLVEYLASVRAAAAIEAPELQHLTATHVHDLLAIALGATNDSAQLAYGRGMRAARLRSARSFILNQLHRFDLSAELIAKYLGVTPRYVHKLFETEALSLTRFIVEQRLVRANRLLADPQASDRNISAIAFAVGFRDLSHFNRSFRRHFAETPSDVRRKNGRPA